MRDILSDLETGEKHDPVEAARRSLRRPLPKRFYEKVETVRDENGIAVTLDKRAVKTPGKNPIRLKSQAAAELLAAEFAAQKKDIDPSTMPVFRLINTAIDGVAADMQAVAEDIIRFSGTDLLCYRAEAPEGLVAAQNEKWDPPLDWIASQIGAPFVLAEGIMAVSQPKHVIAGISMMVRAVDDPIILAALHSMTSITGSAILALNVLEGEMSPHEAFAAAHVDEDWNIAQWGEDDDAKTVRAIRWRDLDAAARLITAIDNSRS